MHADRDDGAPEHSVMPHEIRDGLWIIRWDLVPIDDRTEPLDPPQPSP